MQGTLESPEVSQAEPSLLSKALQKYGIGLPLLGVAIVYGPVLRELAIAWWENPDYSHGLLLPLVSAYLIWKRKEEWKERPAMPSSFGLLVMLGALGLLFLGELGAEFFLTRVSLLAFLAGLVLFLLGWGHLRLAAFPLGILLLAIPLPAVIFYQLTFPLQLVASRLATTGLELAGVPVLRDGNLIMLPNITLEVVEACSGIRSLFTLLTLTILYGYFLESRVWLRVIMVLLTVPLAIFCNALRITGTGFLTQHVDPAAAENFFHTFSGWLIFLVALGTLLAIHRTMTLFTRRAGAAQ
jgi:exosortase